MNSPRQGIRNIPLICAHHGLKHAVITPGSRNAPLIIAFNQCDDITCLSITDERSAGYFALGIARISFEPVALVCTSGTAALNFGPAIAEAYYQNLPLVIFTADRPPEWIDQADGQTIRQAEVFKNHVKKSFVLPVETSDKADLWYHNRLVSQAVDLACQLPQGPVHINVPLREPLYDKLPAASGDVRIIRTVSAGMEISDDETHTLQEKWKQAKKKLIIAGFGTPGKKLLRLLAEVNKDKSVVIIAENLSNLADETFIDTPERFFAAAGDDENEDFRPDLLVTLAGAVVSKRLKQFLRLHKPSEHWDISPWPRFTDTYQSLTRNIMVSPELFLEKIPAIYSPDTVSFDYKGIFIQKEKMIRSNHHSFMKQVPFSDLKAFEQILEAIPPGTDLHLANSTPVRYAQLFNTRPDIRYYSNRGTSGIDGCVSAAAGASFASRNNTTVIAGDLAFIYDSSAIWNNYLTGHFRIIVMNNGGGNIFTLIETSEEMEAIKEYFITPHQVQIRHIAEAFGIKYYFCNDLVTLQKLMKIFFSVAGPSVLEVKTDAAVNTSAFKEYFRQIKNIKK
ncbi:MAG: 2-succinyl-5-enolpyruvyl-6-hydroxy-3-cyclohexene-1-carboxylic-acid synthase [Bacteroidales bacterium]|nr:2-succinyl-5-enolpyruvyl-6-hydroxy-3-cyclohexene-1-carboxylic-acid synthase [Bacteroidales bacterium]